MRLRTKILSGFGAILLLVLFVGAWAVLNLRWLGTASDAILRENYRSILAAENMIDAIERQDSATLLLLDGFHDQGTAQFHTHEVEFLQWLVRAQDNITIAGEAEVLQEISEAYSQYLAGYSAYSGMLVADPARASDFYTSTLLPQFQVIRTRSIDLRNLNQATMLAASNSAQAIALRAIWLTAAIGLTAVLLGLVFSLWLSNRLVQPLRAMSTAADRIAEGEYDLQLDVTAQDELGHLAQRIMTMSYKLKTFHRMNVGNVIAEKRRSEAIIRSVSDGIIVVDSEHKVITLNPVAAHIFDTTVDGSLGRHVYDVIGDERIYNAIKSTCQTGRAWESDGDATYARQMDGQDLFYRYLVTPVRTDGGGQIGAVLLLQDVTKLKKLDQLKSEFVMIASHELRTPLTAIAMSISLLEEQLGPLIAEDQRELLTAADEEVRRLRRLVDDLLDLGKIEAGRLELDFSDVDVAALVYSTVPLLSQQAKQQRIELSIQVASDAAPIRADAGKIAWVLTNLVGNALRYTHAGGHIQVTAEQQGRFVHFCVQDDGVGIPLQYQSRIFEKFIQVEDDHAAGSSGLGLSIAREIVKAHGGSIWVDSTPGKGSAFTFTVPVAAAGHGPAATSSSPRWASQNGVVEDPADGASDYDKRTDSTQYEKEETRV